VGNQAITGNLTDTGNITATGSLSAASETITNTASGIALSVSSPNAYTGINASGGTAVYATGYNTGVYATATTTLNPVAVNAVTSNGTAVQGQDLGSGTSTGVLGLSGSPTGVGVEGEATASSSSSSGIGVLGTTASPAGVGVVGQATWSNTSPQLGIGVYGTSATILEGIGVWGYATGADGIGGLFYGGPSGSELMGNYGVQASGGGDASSEGYGGGGGGNFLGGSSSKSYAGDGGGFIGGTGVAGGNGITATGGVSTGSISYPIAGVVGEGPASSSGTSIAGPGVFGNDEELSITGSIFLGLDIGVWGDVGQVDSPAPTPYALMGTADNAFAVAGFNDAAEYPTLSAQNFSTSSTAPAIEAQTSALGGVAWIGGDGCSGTMGLQLGLSGMSSTCVNYTLQGDTSGNTYLNGSSLGKVVFRINNGTPSPMILNNNGSVTITTLDVTSSLTEPAGSFKIDHPLDPANKYLYHSFVESPDMKNIYDGDVTTDASGLATVTLPDWFQALNRDFRYQLTVIGQFAQAIVAKKIENNQFQIRTSLPNVEVSWQVTGIRQDAFANAHRIQTEVEKAPQDQGHYLHPELFGAPETARIGYEPPSKLAPAGEKSESASASPPFGHSISPLP
jgi:trimeric autotransporter adhesin